MSRLSFYTSGKMICVKTISVIAAFAFASQAIAEPLGNKLFKSTRDVFGLEARDDASYISKAAVCGMGSDCSSVSFSPNHSIWT